MYFTYIYIICIIYIHIYTYLFFVYTTDKYSTDPRICTFGIVIHCIGLGCQSLHPQEIHVCNRNFVFDLHSVFHEYNPGIKCDLPV